MKQYHENFRIAAYDKVRNDKKQGGYKYLIQTSFYSYAAFRTDKGFHDWLQRSNLKLQFKKTTTEYTREENKRVDLYEAKGVIETFSFWRIEEVPKYAKHFKGLCNGSLVDCYYVHTEKGSQIYKPNPNAKDIYKPFSLDDHLEFITING